jgi:hypothetical protein
MTKWNKIIACMLVMCFLVTQVSAQIPEKPYASARETLATHSQQKSVKDLYERMFGKKGKPTQTIKGSTVKDAADETPAATTEQDNRASSDKKIIRQFNGGIVAAVFYVGTTSSWIIFLMPVMRKLAYDILHDGVRENFWDLAYVLFNNHALDFYTASGILAAVFLYAALMIYGYSACRYLINNLMGFGKMRMKQSDLARYITMGAQGIRVMLPLLATAAIYYFEVWEPDNLAHLGSFYNGTTSSFGDVIAMIAGFTVFSYYFVRAAFKTAWQKTETFWQLIRDMVSISREDDLGPTFDELDRAAPAKEEPVVKDEKPVVENDQNIARSANKDIPFTITRFLRSGMKEITTIVNGEITVTTIVAPESVNTYTPQGFDEFESFELDSRALMAA